MMTVWKCKIRNRIPAARARAVVSVWRHKIQEGYSPPCSRSLGSCRSSLTRSKITSRIPRKTSWGCISSISSIPTMTTSSSTTFVPSCVVSISSPSRPMLTAPTISSKSRPHQFRPQTRYFSSYFSAGSGFYAFLGHSNSGWSSYHSPSLSRSLSISHSPSRWYDDGLGFKCTRCGKCCMGEVDVWINMSEAVGMAKHLGIEVESFLSTYTTAVQSAQSNGNPSSDPTPDSANPSSTSNPTPNSNYTSNSNSDSNSNSNANSNSAPTSNSHFTTSNSHSHSNPNSHSQSHSDSNSNSTSNSTSNANLISISNLNANTNPTATSNSDDSMSPLTSETQRINGDREIEHLRFKLKTVDGSQGLQCVFLNRQKSSLQRGESQNHQHTYTCMVYHEQPTMCRTYPFLPGAVTSLFDWKVMGSRCEGIQIPGGNIPESNSPKSHAAGDLANNVVSREEIEQALAINLIHRHGGTFRFSDSAMLLSELGREAIDDVCDDLFRTYQTQIVHQSDFLTVTDHISLDPDPNPSPKANLPHTQSHKVIKRSLTFNQDLSLSQTEVMLNPLTGHPDWTQLPMPIHAGMALVTCAHLSLEQDGDKIGRRVAVIGAGAGAFPMFLHTLSLEHVQLWGVEPDLEVLDAGVSHFWAPKGISLDEFKKQNLREIAPQTKIQTENHRQPRLTTYQECQSPGPVFIHSTGEEFLDALAPSVALDVLVIDAFADSHAPPRTLVDFHLFRHLLRPRGCLVVNLVGDKNWKKKCVDLARKTFERAFLATCHSPDRKGESNLIVAYAQPDSNLDMSLASESSLHMSSETIQEKIQHGSNELKNMSKNLSNLPKQKSQLVINSNQSWQLSLVML
uniref:Uncharacterized protein n=3 Tax=Amorphochlora amoebiformis TaxID=1561963 RepID=A0A7S0GPP6_9EUKA|mmetsp:Transcript_12948/g.20511  ORF Transcript_12948/g.20511 Transcript_12948/m.20511 type:complete len:851 (+) Transcript_12948:160-2712(+)